MSKEKTFEESLALLEQIINKLEDQETPLEEAMALFGEGVALSSECAKKLEDAKQAVHILVSGNGEMTKEEFLPDE